MKLYYKNINDIIYVYKGILNYKLERYDKKLTLDLINKHDKDYIDREYLFTLKKETRENYWKFVEMMEEDYHEY